MMKVLLVDDELIVRTGLNAIVHWKECGMEVVAEAANGQNALVILKEQAIDLVITDIRMPSIDGIELTRKVRETYPKIKVILLTCYDDFKYVQEALEMGASGYVLKTDMEDGVLEKILRKVRKEWEQENVKKEEYERLQWKVEKSLPLLREKYMRALMEHDDVNSQEQSAFLGLQWLNQPHRLLLLEFESHSMLSVNETERLFYQIAGEEAFIFRWDEGSFLAFVKQPGENSLNKILLWNYQLTQRLFAKMKTFTDQLNLYYYPSSDPRQIRSGFFRLKQLSEYYTFYHGFGQILDAGNMNVPEGGEAAAHFDWKAYKQLAIIRNWSKMKEKCCEIFEGFDHHRYSVEYVKRSTMEMIGIIMDVLQSNGHLVNTNWGSNKFDYVEMVKEIRTISELSEFLYQGIEALEESRTVFIGGMNKVIEKAVEYIERNYDKDITLDDLSSYVGLSKSYLSSSFKKVTGENFIDYLIHLRIEKAKQLFRQTDLKTYEVAEKVGIQDPKYFTKLFKRIEGVSPKTFKDIMVL